MGRTSPRGIAMKVLKIMEQLRQMEHDLIGSEIISVCQRNANIIVRINGLKKEYKTNFNHDEIVIAVFKIVSFDRAEFIRPATPGEKRKFLARFPTIRAVTVSKVEDDRFLCIDHSGTSLETGEMFLVVGCPPSTFPFRPINCASTGNSMLFVSNANTTDSFATKALFQEILLPTPRNPKDIKVKYATPWQIKAYEIAYNQIQLEKVETLDDRVKKAVEYMNGRLISYVEIDNELMNVSFMVDGRSFTSTINKETLQIVHAGICLDGEDRKFDLTTLVPIMRKGIRANRIVDTGTYRYGNDDYDD